MRDYAADKGIFWRKCFKFSRMQQIAVLYYLLVSESFKNFFVDFCQTDDEGNKNFKYAEQLTRLAHREQVLFVWKTP